VISDGVSCYGIRSMSIATHSPRAEELYHGNGKNSGPARVSHGGASEWDSSASVRRAARGVHAPRTFEPNAMAGSVTIVVAG